MIPKGFSNFNLRPISLLKTGLSIFNVNDARRYERNPQISLTSVRTS